VVALPVSVEVEFTMIGGGGAGVVVATIAAVELFTGGVLVGVDVAAVDVSFSVVTVTAGIFTIVVLEPVSSVLETFATSASDEVAVEVPVTIGVGAGVGTGVPAAGIPKLVKGDDCTESVEEGGA
jgi:hypothetical protein